MQAVSDSSNKSQPVANIEYISHFNKIESILMRNCVYARTYIYANQFMFVHGVECISGASKGIFSHFNYNALSKRTFVYLSYILFLFLEKTPLECHVTMSVLSMAAALLAFHMVRLWRRR